MKWMLLALGLTTGVAACGDRTDGPRLPEYQGLALGISQDSAVAVADALGLEMSCTARYDPTNGAELTVCTMPETVVGTEAQTSVLSAVLDASDRVQAALIARPAGAAAGPWLDSLFTRWGEPQEVHRSLHRWYIDHWMVEADTTGPYWQVAISDTTWNRRLNALE